MLQWVFLAVGIWAVPLAACLMGLVFGLAFKFSRNTIRSAKSGWHQRGVGSSLSESFKAAWRQSPNWRQLVPLAAKWPHRLVVGRMKLVARKRARQDFRITRVQKREDLCEFRKVTYGRCLTVTHTETIRVLYVRRLSQPGPCVDAWTTGNDGGLIRSAKGELAFCFDEACQVAEAALRGELTITKPGYGAEAAFGAIWKLSGGGQLPDLEENMFLLCVPGRQSPIIWVGCTIRPDGSHIAISGDGEDCGLGGLLYQLNALVEMAEIAIPQKMRKRV